MLFKKDRTLLIAALLCTIYCTQGGRAARWLVYDNNNFHFDFKTDYKGEVVYLKNCFYFSGNQLDQAFYGQSTWDATLHARCSEMINSKLTLRNRAFWGSTQSVWTDESAITISDYTQPNHTHGFSRMAPWIRRAWVKFCFNDAFDINSERKHYFKLGLFPFEVGRGISLGNAYALGVGLLGFFTDNDVDQYAPGALLHGDICTRLGLTYDAYAGLLENNSTMVAENTEPIYSHEVNHPTIYQGYGAITYVLVGRLFWTLFNNEHTGILTAESYGLFYRGPNNPNEFLADGDVRLGTFGVAVEYNGPRWELGWETALNCGNQRVRPWDRNYIVLQKNDNSAVIQQVNSAIYQGGTHADGKPLALVTDANQAAIEQGGYGAAFNNKQIDTSGLYNGPFRFRKEYYNRLGGHMFVTDAAYWIRPKTLKIAATVAYASGDENPNVALTNPAETEVTRTYGGFIGLQEIYSGKRVRSLFVLGSLLIARPQTAPDVSLDTVTQRYAANVDGFANLVYTGIGLTWKPDNYKRKVTLNPNILYYWQDFAVKKFCLACRGDQISNTLPKNASKALGLEVNMLGEVSWLDNLKGFAALGVFVPGAHYTDVIGKPVDDEQVVEVYRPERRGIECNEYPLLNNKTAFLLNIGFEYLF